MKVKTKPVWELTEAEFEHRITPAVEAARQRRFEKDLPISYQDETVCETANQFVHEYSDGRKYLVELNVSSRQYKTIRELNG